MKIYETPIINVKKFHAEVIVTSSGRFGTKAEFKRRIQRRIFQHDIS